MTWHRARPGGQLPSPSQASLSPGGCRWGREVYGGSCCGNTGGRGSRARSCQDRVIKEAGEESRDNARGNSREFRNLRCTHSCHTSSPVIAVHQVSGRVCLITRPERHELGIGTRSHPSEQCPPGPEPHRSSLCIHPFPSPVDMQGETLLLQN